MIIMLLIYVSSGPSSSMHCYLNKVIGQVSVKSSSNSLIFLLKNVSDFPYNALEIQL